MNISKILMSLFFGISLSNSAYSRTFGSSGWDGSDGRNGRSGKDGLSETINADGRFQTVDVSGYNGSDGYDGEYGEDARSCRQPRNEANDLRGASGGDGGDGGDGGRGGSSGNVAVFFDNDADLRNITVYSIPGTGGYAGEGRSAGYGCRCSQRSWEIRDANGGVRTYHCRDGSNGWRGSRGSTGSQGWEGDVKIIKGRSSIPPERPSVSQSLMTFVNSSTDLIKNIWNIVPNGSRYFSDSSRMPNSISRFDGIAIGTINMTWESPRPLDHFSNASASVSINNSSSLTFTPANNLAMLYSEEGEEDNKNIIIHEAVYTQELEAIRFTNSEGAGSQIVINLEDTAQIGDIVKTSIHLKYKTQKFIIYGIRFEDVVPANALIIENRKITINIGSLPINRKYLKAGTNTKIVIKVTREFAGKFRTKEIKEKFKIPE